MAKPPIVIKYGGNAITETQSLNRFSTAIASLVANNDAVIIVHGGGPQISYWLERSGIESHFVNGERYTDPDALSIVEMVLCAAVNKALVRALQQAGVNAAGISGEDGRLLRAEAKPGLGAVGTISATQPALVFALLERGFVPVIAPLGCARDYTTARNINADYAAAHIAAAVGAEECLFLTNVDGLLDAQKNRIAQTSSDAISAMIDDGTIGAGMIPKVNCVRTALRLGVARCRIINGTEMSALLAARRGESVGTVIYS